MKRLAWMLFLGSFGLSATTSAYDGPGTPLVYNQIINNITVLMTVQPVVLNGGISRFTMTAQVPIEADTIGKNITLQLRRYIPDTNPNDGPIITPGFTVLDSCTVTPAPGSVGTTVSFSCNEEFNSIGTGLTVGSTVGLYPYVQRPADVPISVLTHDGVAQRLNVPVVGEDADDGGQDPVLVGLNDTLGNATNLGTPVGTVLTRDNRVSFRPDYYRFTVPAGVGSMEIRLDFWNTASDIDLTLFDSGGSELTSSPFSEDFEQINWDVNPGESYYIRAEQASTQPGFYNITITFTIRDTVTITAGPTATPNVVSAGGTTSLSVTAVDSVGHDLSYFWSQVCPGSIGNGTFSDRFIANPTWTAPANTTGSPKQCTIRATVDDARGNNATATVIVTIGLSGDFIDFTVLPTGTPNPVTPPASVALDTNATDSFGHPLSYSWTANCPTLPNHGTFTPNANQRQPTWTPPTNNTGSTQSCTMTVTVGDGFGIFATAGYSQQVATSPHLLSITAGPTGVPNPVASGANVAMSVTAVDTLGHGLNYTWSAVCNGGMGSGTFANATGPTPTWTAPANLTGGAQTCAIQVIVDDGGFGLSQTGNYVHTVNAAPNTVSITAGPIGTPNPVASGENVSATVTATDLLGRTLAYAWAAVCTGGIGNGAFVNGTTATPTWTAPANLTGVERTCTLSVIVNDGFGATANGSYQQAVSPAPNPITITAGPTGTPNPGESGALVAMSVTASDVLGRTLIYAWSATCAGGIGNGTFANGTTASPSWAAPVNSTAVAQACTIQVDINDGFGNTQTGSYVQTVNTAPNPITITAGPTGAPNPAASEGSVAMTVTANDVLGRTLAYAWSAVCAGGIGNGTFANGTTATPTWTAPANLSGLAQACTIGVTIDDGFSNTQSGSYVQTVNPAPNPITITAGPSGAPNPAPSGATVAMTVTATDVLGRTLAYAWSAVCGGGIGNGTFANGSTASPSWTAPTNLTGVSQTCAIDVTVNDGFGNTQAGTYQQAVSPEPNPITITAGPTGTPNPVASAGSVAMTVTASDVLGRTLSYAWSAVCASGIGNGSFADGTTASPTWTAPANNDGIARACTVSVTVSDAFGNSQAGAYEQTVSPAPNPITITAGPTGAPNPVSSGGTVTASVTASDTLGRTLAYVWSAVCPVDLGSGTFTPPTSASVSWTAPANLSGVAKICTISVIVSDGFGFEATGSYQQTVDAAPNTVTITAGPTGAPNPVASAGVVAMTVTAGDLLGRTLSYAWSVVCAGGIGNGAFVNDTTATPSWTAPANLSGVAQDCTVNVSVNDGFGNSQGGTYQQVVSAAPNPITITAGPTGAPNPVESAGTVAMTVAASDVLGRTLAYAWSAACAGGLGNGSFANGTTATPTWSAPANNSGTAQLCMVNVSVDDGFGNTQAGSYQQTVNAAPNPITITAGPTGAPNPVASAGSVAMSVAASDVLGRTLAYAWSAVCSGGIGNGSFANGTTATPTWTAPANVSGLPRTCAIGVTVSDGFGFEATGSYEQTVNDAPNAITITAGPTGTPNPVASAGGVAMSVTATDVLGRTLGYAWAAVCAGGIGNGTFTNGSTATPSWTAPANLSGVDQACTVTVTVDDGFGNTQAGSYQQTVSAAPNPITITAGPTGTPNPVESAGNVAMTVTAADVLGRTLAYAWSTVCAGGIGNGTFANGTSATPTWTAPANTSGSAQLCTVNVSVNDGFGNTQAGSYQQTVSAAPNPITITAGPTGTPNPVASEGPVAMTVTAGDVLGRTLAYAWTAVCTGGLGNGAFANGTTATPAWTAPANVTGSAKDCTISVTVNDGFGNTQAGSYQQTVNAAANAITITAGPTGAPNPVASAGTVAMTVTATDVLGRTLNYAWSATCNGGLGSGTFTNGTTATPSWAAPANLTGAGQACTIGVTVDDSLGTTQSASYQQTVDPAANTVTITAGPTGAPNPVASAGSVAASVTATDTLGRTLAYAWSATCGGGLGTGTFANGTTASPTWTAPANLTGSAQTCTLGVTVTDGFGASATGSYQQAVDSVENVITITTAANGTPNPVASGGTVDASVAATNSLNRSLSYAWSATCAGGLGTGSFGSASSASTTWTAPANLTGTTQACTLQALITEPVGGISQTSSYTQNVNSVPHTVTVTQQPTGTPNPVASGGTAALSVVVTDSLDRTLTYQWTATCAGGLGNGSFANGTTATPSWTAPVNTTGSTQACTIQVVATEPTDNISATASYTQSVASTGHTLTITQAPSGTPNPVASGGAAAVSVVASDSLGRALSYAWTAACAGGIGSGSFANGTTAAPSWTAPSNATGTPQACTIGVTVTEPIDGLTANASYTHTVNSVLHTINTTQQPRGNPNPSPSGGPSNFSVIMVDTLGHELTYSWTAFCPSGLGGNGSFENGTTATPIWTAPVNNTGSLQTCTIFVTGSDAFGQLRTSFFLQSVSTAPAHTLTITQQPSGTPNPVVSAGLVAMSVVATDSLNRALTYAWTASCAGGLGNGTFANETTASPSWTAPANLTGTPQACTVGVTVTEPIDGLTQLASYTQTVNSVGHTLTITQQPSGAPNPVASEGVVAMSVVASDSLSRALTYAWTATCAGGLGNGTFADGTTATPTWTAPANTTGTAQACTIGVTVTEPVDGLSEAASYTQTVNSVGHTLTITAGPDGTPNPVASEGIVNVSVVADDSLGRALTYAWTATCAGGLGNGAFANATTATPTWTAPANATGTAKACTIEVTVSEPIGELSQTASYTQTVSSVGHTLTLTQQPTGTPNPAASGAPVAVSVAASDSLNRTLTYAWSATCAGGIGNGIFADAAAAATTWTAPENLTGTPQACAMSVTVTEPVDALTETAGYTQTVSSVEHTLTITQQASGTPNPVVSAGTVSMSVVASDSLNRTLTYAWSATCAGGIGNGTFANGTTATASWTAPANSTGSSQSCTVSVTVTEPIDGLTETGNYTQTVNSIEHTLTITQQASGTPNPVASAGTVDMSVAAEDSLNRALTYAWSATCAGGIGNGAFANGTTATPSWTAPANTTGSAQSCAVSVTVTEPIDGLTETGNYTQTVNSIEHTLTITQQASGTPNPVASAGTVDMSVAAEDSLNRALTYAWSATCAGGIGNGTFANGTTATPSWAAPANLTGNPVACAISVTVTEPIDGLTQGSGYTQTVESVEHTLTITQQPTGTPNPVASSATANLGVAASDSLNRTLSYAWTATCGGGLGSGSFANGTTATPTWTAPANNSGAPQACTIGVTVTEPIDGLTQAASYSHTVNAVPASLTITAGPTGTPNPVSVGGMVALTVTAVHSASRPLSYQWAAACATGGNGAFSNTTAQNPTWVPSVITPGTSTTCTMSVVVSDGEGLTASQSYVQTVNAPTTHTLTIVQQPRGTPNPSGAGAPVQLGVVVLDSFGHSLNYLWQSLCIGGANGGTFSPNANSAAPIWTPPAGSDLTCLVSVLVIDNQGLSATGNFVQRVTPTAPRTVTITQAANGTPNPVASAGTVNVSATAVDSQGGAVTYQWTATCAVALGGSGTFSNAAAQAPTWVAPVNTTGVAQTCTLQVTASNGVGQTAQSSYAQTVNAAPPPPVTMTSAPTGTPNPVLSGGSVTLAVAATSGGGLPVSYAWSSVCGGTGGNGTFSNATAQNPTWAAPANTSGSTVSCTMSVIASNSQGGQASASYVQQVTSAPPPHTLTITAGPSGTPNPVATGGTANLTVTAVDSLSHALSYTWTATCPAVLASHGVFSPSNTVRTPSWAAPVNNTGSPQTCVMSVTVTDNQGLTQTGTYNQVINAGAVTHTLTLSGLSGSPNPALFGQAVNLSVTAVDTLGHALNYLWQANCLGVGSGTFSPNAAAPAPVWTAPAGTSDTICLISVTVTDNVDKVVSSSFTQRLTTNAIQPVQTLSFVSSPTGAPNPAPPAATVALSAQAQDTLGRTLSYQWTASCPGLANHGVFAPSASVRTPSWSAPENATGATQTCTMQVTASDGFGESITASYAQRVNSIPHLLSITSGPTGSPNPVTPAGAVTLSATATDSLNHTLSYLWQASCPVELGSSGTFSPSASVPAPLWTPPSTTGTVDYSCAIRVTVTDSVAKSVQATYSQRVTNTPVTETVETEARSLDRGPDFYDTDLDGMDDAWERAHGLDPDEAADGELDLDEDGLDNEAEYDHQADPRRADSDGDRVLDGAEVANGDNPADAADWTPPALRATVGDRVVYLAWRGEPRTDEDGAGLLIERAGENGEFVSLGTVALVRSAGGYRLDRLPDGSALSNDDVYRFGLVMKRGAITRPPADVEQMLARAGGVEGVSAPAEPVLVLPGTDASSFGDTLHFAAGTLGWRFGGRFCFDGSTFTPRVGFDLLGTATGADGGSDRCDGLAELTSGRMAETSSGALSGSVFAVDFGAEAVGQRVREVGGALEALASNGVAGTVTLLGEGAGAEAGQAWLLATGNEPRRVSALIADGGGAANACEVRSLPANVAYTTIGQAPGAASCVGDTASLLTDDTGVEAAVTPSVVRFVESDREAGRLGNDLGSVFCAMSAQCVIVRTAAAVDLTVTAPDGRRVSSRRAEIPGASFMTSGETGSAIILPFAGTGEYRIEATPRTGTKTWSVDVIRGGETTVLSGRRAKESTAIYSVLMP